MYMFKNLMFNHSSPSYFLRILAIFGQAYWFANYFDFN